MRNLMMMAILGLMVACNTVEGVGRDIQSGGEAISDGARDVKEAITE